MTRIEGFSGDYNKWDGHPTQSNEDMDRRIRIAETAAALEMGASIQPVFMEDLALSFKVGDVGERWRTAVLEKAIIEGDHHNIKLVLASEKVQGIPSAETLFEIFPLRNPEN